MVINQPCFTRNHSESKSSEESHRSIIKWTCWLECNEARQQLFDQRLHQVFLWNACLLVTEYSWRGNQRVCKQLLIFYIRGGSVIQRHKFVWQSSQFCIACRWIFIVAMQIASIHKLFILLVCVPFLTWSWSCAWSWSWSWSCASTKMCFVLRNIQTFGFWVSLLTGDWCYRWYQIL